ncbi:Na-translocating system protein MpsC family protein [Paenibacillus chartarius]|uniref:Na-translocating system protein MpsC family protein n=1 Tax=Paenibacillus chartarius TaxID=747481 RepID=A0ABV6DRR4_9BACL
MENAQINSALSGHIGKLLRDTFGKGPQSLHISIKRPIIVIQMRQFLNPMEHVLIDQQKEDTVFQTRAVIMDKLIPEIKAFIQVIAGMEIHEFYYDWGLHNGSGVMVGVESHALDTGDGIPDEPFPGKTELLAEIARISTQVQKPPENLRAVLLNERTLLVFRDGVLIAIEKELIRQGYERILKSTKRILEKKYLHNNAALEGMLRTRIFDIFVDWDFQLDKSVMVFILKPWTP